MGSLFSSPRPVSAPRVAPPVAIPDVGPEPGDIARRRAPRGRRETFLTGDLVPEANGKRTLG